MNVQKGMLYIGEFQHRIFYPTPKSHWLRCPSRRDQPSARVRLRAPRPRPLRIWGASGDGVFHPRKCAGAVRHARRQYRAQLGLGFGDAEIRVYDPARAHRGGSYLVEGHHCPLYFLDDATLVQTLTVPPMAEGIDTHDGQVYLANESASNLYLLGKFFGGSYVYAFPTP